MNVMPIQYIWIFYRLLLRWSGNRGRGVCLRSLVAPVDIVVGVLGRQRVFVINRCNVGMKGIHTRVYIHGASCQIRKIAGAHAPGMPGTFSPSPRVSDPDMHHGTCVTHVPWCISGSLTSGFLWNRRRGKTFPAFPVHAQPAILRIW